MNKFEAGQFKSWWILAIKGFLTLAFGFVALTLKDINQIKIVSYFSYIISISGLLLTHGALYNLGRKLPWKWWFFEGLFDLVIGVVIIYIIVNYRIVAGAMYTEIIALWALVFGVIQIITAFRFKKYSLSWGSMLTCGLLAIVYCLIIWQNTLPGFGARSTAIGVFAMILGVIIIVNAINLSRNK